MTAIGALMSVMGIFLMMLLLIWLGSCLMLLKPREARMVYSWVGGSVQRTITEAGLHFKLPFPFQSASKPISLAEQMLNVTNRARSKEEAFFDLEVKAIVQIRPDSVKAAIFNMTNPKQQITASMSEAVKRVTPTLSLADIYADRELIRNEVKETLNEVYNKHGWECLEVIVEDPKLESSIEEASNKRIENRRRVEAAEDLKRAIFLEETANAEAAAESLRLRTKAAGEAKKAYTKEIVESITEFRTAHPDLNPDMLMGSMEGLDRRDSIVTASGNPASVIVVDTASDRGRQYADMAAYEKGQKDQSTTERVSTPAPAVEA